MFTRKKPSEYQQAKNLLQRQSLLLRGGLPSAKIWSTLAGEGHRVAQRLEMAAAKTNTSVEDALTALQHPVWRLYAAVLTVAKTSGAPLALACERLAGALQELETIRQKRGVLLAGPKISTTIICSLPIFAIGIGYLMGFDPVRVLTTGFGVLLAAAGLTLLTIGALWIRVLIKRVEQAEIIAGIECELLIIALGGGKPINEAVRLVVDSLDKTETAWCDLKQFTREGEVTKALNTAVLVGTPVSQMLLETAHSQRQEVQAKLAKQAEKLGVKVLLPMSCCVLPAFMLLGVVPVLMSIIGEMF